MTPQQSRTEINRANAQHSTGPKTEAGKQRSALNAVRHGLTGQLVVMPTEDLHAYQRHLKSLTDHYDPQDPTEALLVQALADTAWRLNRVAALETNLLTLAAANQPNPVADAPAQVMDALSVVAALESQTKALANLSMHTQRLSRQFEKTLLLLRDLQKTRQVQQHQELDDLLEITDMFEAKGQPYDPKEDGFVFSQSQLNARIQARNRDYLLAEAREYNE